MAQLSIRVKNNKLDITLDYILRFYGSTYSSTVNQDGVTIPNPITKQQFLESLLESQIRSIFQTYDKQDKVKIYENTIVP